jgi:CheY-like chemotaxis protein
VSEKKRILIVEDDSDDAALLLVMLQAANPDRHVKVINDGAEAWENLVDRDPMPKSSSRIPGFEVTDNHAVDLVSYLVSNIKKLI